MDSFLTEQDLKDFVRKIDDNITVRKEQNDHYLYYNNRDMGIGVCGKLDNGGEWTFQTLSIEIDYYLKERRIAKLIIAEKVSAGVERKAPKKKTIHKRDSRERF